MWSQFISYQQTPLYDVMSAALYPQFLAQKAKLAMSFGDRRYYRISQIQLRHFYQTGQKAGMHEQDMESIFSELVVRVKISTSAEGAKNWSRLEIAQYCLKALESDVPAIIGIDHGFSFPMSYMRRYGISSWDDFLKDFMLHWPTADPHTYVDFLREDNPRTGDSSELRLCEQWTATAKSVFLFDLQGSVAKSTHTGLPWLLWLREMPGIRPHVHFWPFDGFEVPAGKSVIAEAYPAVYKRRFPREDRSPDEYDAWSIAAWLQETDRRGILDRYFEPPLTLPERKQVELEGWILGVW